MENYYSYFVQKGHHPNKEQILQQEKEYVFEMMNKEIAQKIIDKIVSITRKYHKPVAARILYHDEVIAEYNEKNDISWLIRKEKVCYQTRHSSYYIFLDSMDTTIYNDMIADDTYGVCGGAFPLIVNEHMVGSIAVSGLRPHEDHETIIEALNDILKD